MIYFLLLLENRLNYLDYTLITFLIYFKYIKIV